MSTVLGAIQYKDCSDHVISVRAALILETGCARLPVLDRARVSRITESDMVINGLELILRNQLSKANIDRHPKTWWMRVAGQKVSPDSCNWNAKVLNGGRIDIEFLHRQTRWKSRTQSYRLDPGPASIPEEWLSCT